jgi:RHS repeat-associated protein
MYDNLKQFGSDPFTYTYNTANNQYSTSGVAYDADGDLTYDGVNNYTYNAQDKLWSVYPTGGSATSYVYDAFGHMVERESGGSYTQTLYGPNGQKLAGMSGQTLSYAFIPMPGGSQVLTSGASTFYYLHLDWLGSARTASTIPTSGTGTIFFDRQFAPYSQMYGNSGSAGTGSQMFTGDTHQSVGLFDTPNRELNQSQGRWLTPDPAHSGWNLYAYATDPNTSTDPTGLACYPLEKQMFGSCAGFMNNGANFGSSWNEFDILNWALTAYIGVIPDPDRTVNYPYGWIDYESGAFYSPGTYVFGWNYGNTFFPYAWLLDFDAGSYFNSYYNAKRSDARSLATSEDYIGALGSIARKAPDLCNPGISASAKIAGYGPEVTVDQSGVHGDFSVGLGKYAEVGTADPSITFSAGEGLGGSVTLNADRPGIPTVGAFAGVRTSNKLLEVDANVHADVVAMGSCPQ